MAKKLIKIDDFAKKNSGGGAGLQKTSGINHTNIINYTDFLVYLVLQLVIS